MEEENKKKNGKMVKGNCDKMPPRLKREDEATVGGQLLETWVM